MLHSCSCPVNRVEDVNQHPPCPIDDYLFMSLQHCKRRGSPRKDGINNQSLNNLGSATREIILGFFNEVWQTAFVTETWRTAIAISIMKSSKSPSNSWSYPPTSLMSCFGKLFNRMIHRRLTGLLESRDGSVQTTALHSRQWWGPGFLSGGGP